jgi:hemerythrin-like metal-binding protein
MNQVTNTPLHPDADTMKALLAWSPELVLHDPRTDATHQEFIDLLNATSASDPAHKLPLYQALVEHTVAHFGQEERWMLACGITAEHCHFSQHSSVLEVMKEVERRAVAGDTGLIDQMLEALVEWFPMHAQSMDAGLVAFLNEAGFDTTSETLSPPEAALHASVTTA